MTTKALEIVIAEDDLDDQFLIGKALKNSRLANDIRFVDNGAELMKYLRREGDYAELKDNPLPGIILLDLNMPIMDGREALAEIKSDPALKSIPVVILTTSEAEEDVFRSYDLGVNSFVTKPVTLDGLITVVQSLADYWFEIVRLPGEGANE